MKRMIAVIGLLVAALIGLAVRPAMAGGVDPDENHVDHWCPYAGYKWDWDAGQLGSKQHYTVPPNHVGHIWTLLVIKAGTQNTVFHNPIPGHIYYPANGKDISHVILCKELIPEQTTTTSSTTSTTTTEAPTTTVEATTTTTAVSSDTLPIVTTTSVATSQPPVASLPATGANDRVYILYALGLILGGMGMSLLWIQAKRSK